MLSSENLSNALRAVASALQIPVTVVLLLMLALTAVIIGTVTAELFTERLRLRARLPLLADSLRADKSNIKKTIEGSGLLRRQRKALLELTAHPELTPAMRESLAVRLIAGEREHYDMIVKLTDTIARLGPMFGLLGTLIPLGPGIIALGRGDTYTLSASMLTAFDTTIAGLLCAAAAFVISAVRKKWYAKYMSDLELVMECVLEAVNSDE